MTQDMKITEDDLLTWELQLKAEGTLPPDAQRLLLSLVRDLEAEVAMAEDLRLGEIAELEKSQAAEIEELESKISDLNDEVAGLQREIDQMNQQEPA